MTNQIASTVLTERVDVTGIRFAYRRIGDGAVPLVLLNHLAGNLDNWDPRVVDGLSRRRAVITFDNRGVGASQGRTPASIEEMARDAVAFIAALGLDQVDLLGFSMGGFIAQLIAADHPDLVRRLILAGTGPAGGVGIDQVTRITVTDMAHGALTRRDAKTYLFFTRTANGRDQAAAFLQRLQERGSDRDTSVSLTTFRAQLSAIHRWGSHQPDDLSAIHQPALVVNGDTDRMVPTANTRDLARRIPDSQLEIYPDAGHGGIFQHHQQFVDQADAFLTA